MDFGDNVYSYTRKQAIEDGVLHDITELAKEAGFKIPVAVTNGLYNEYLSPTTTEKDMGQSFKGRAWDMLMITRFSCRNCDTSILKLKMDVMYEVKSKTVDFKAIIGPGDSMEPVLTIMLPNED